MAVLDHDHGSILSAVIDPKTPKELARALRAEIRSCDTCRQRLARIANVIMEALDVAISSSIREEEEDLERSLQETADKLDLFVKDRLLELNEKQRNADIRISWDGQLLTARVFRPSCASTFKTVQIVGGDVENLKLTISQQIVSFDEHGRTTILLGITDSWALVAIVALHTENGRLSFKFS